MKLRGRIRALTITAATAGVLGGSMLFAGVASAAPNSVNTLTAKSVSAVTAKVTPDFPDECGGNVCAALVSNDSGVVTIRAYPPNYTFEGWFELQTPNHRTINSIDSTWHAGGTGNWFNDINGGNGEYCVTAWTAGPTKIGYACITTS